MIKTNLLNEISVNKLHTVRKKYFALAFEEMSSFRMIQIESWGNWKVANFVTYFFYSLKLREHFRKLWNKMKINKTKIYLSKNIVFIRNYRSFLDFFRENSVNILFFFVRISGILSTCVALQWPSSFREFA